MVRRFSVSQTLADWRRAYRRLERATRARALAVKRADPVRVVRAMDRERDARRAEVAAHGEFRRAREAVEDRYRR